MAPKYKFTYFNMRARGEPTRLIFTAAGVEFEDVRIDFDKWKDLKESAPMGQLPMLEVDGVKICQSMSIARFAAKETGLAGKTNLEQAQADMFVDEISELLPKLAGAVMASDEAVKAEKAKEVDKLISEKLGRLEKLSGANGHLVGDSLLWCDLVVFNVAFNVENYKPGTLKNYPKLNKVMDTVKANERIAAWIAKRPETKF